MRVLLLLILAGLAGCAGSESGEPAGLPFFDLQTSAFLDEGKIPSRYTCDGEDISMFISWAAIPNGTTHYAFVMDDPDAPAGRFIHWTWWNVPVEQRALPKDVDVTVVGAVEGENSFGNIGYNGPCPPAGEEHQYVLTVYALSAPLELPSGSSITELEDALSLHAIGIGVYRGTYERLAN